MGGFEVFGRRPASGWGAGGRAKRSVASLGGPASPEALLYTFFKEYCFKEFRISFPAELGRHIGFSYARGAELAMQQGGKRTLYINILFGCIRRSLRSWRAVDRKRMHRNFGKMHESLNFFGVGSILVPETQPHSYNSPQTRLLNRNRLAMLHATLPVSNYVRLPVSHLYNAQPQPDLSYSFIPFSLLSTYATLPFPFHRLFVSFLHVLDFKRS